MSSPLPCSPVIREWLCKKAQIEKKICIPSFNVRWNDHFVIHLFLMYRYGINTNILHLKVSHAEF